MFFFGRKAIVWIQGASLSVFFLAKKPITASFNLKLDSDKKPEDLKSLSVFFKENKVKKVSILISEPLSGQQSFVYDASAEKISRKEVVDIAKNSFPFDIDNPYLQYHFHQKSDKTVIRVTAVNQTKLENIQKNLQKLKVKILGFDLVSSSLAKVFSRFHSKPFIVLYGLDKKKTLVLIGHESRPYVSELKTGPSPKIQSTVNKIKMFFETGPLDKIFFQSGCLPDLKGDNKLHIVDFTSENIAQKLKFSKDLPLPVLGILLKLKKQLIKIKTKTMPVEEKSDPTPIMVPEKNDKINEPIKADEPTKTDEPVKDDESEEAFKILAANQQDKFSKRKIITLAVVSALVTVIVLALFLFKPFSKPVSEKQEEPMAQIAPTATPELTATPTPSPEIFYEAKTKVQNATSISGLAAVLVSNLDDLGFEDTTAANAAQKSDENTISCKEDYLITATFIQEALKETYPATLSAEIEEDAGYDIILTIGQNLEEKIDSNEETETQDQESEE